MIFGAIWFLQGINVLPGRFMTGEIRWAVYQRPPSTVRPTWGNKFIFARGLGLPVTQREAETPQ